MGISGAERMLSGLLDGSHYASMEQLPALVAQHATGAGLHEALIYLTDLQQNVLRLLPAKPEDEEARGESDESWRKDAPAEIRIEGTLAGRAFQRSRGVSESTGEGAGRWWVPLLDGTERLGVLRITPELDDDEARDRMWSLASLVAMLVASKRDYSDSFARLVRTRAMSVAAEMQWQVMPPLTFIGEEIAIGAVLEPAYEVGGDAFDYAIDGDTVHLAVFDAMGHDTAAGLTANLAIATCRNQRRQGGTLLQKAEEIERALIEQFAGNRYTTAIIAEFDLRTGELSLINRGHHPPVLIRGGRWNCELECPPGHPLGTDLGLETIVCHEQLEPGDRLILYTDGITEARDASGREFGLERFVDFVIRHHADGLPVPETLRRLMHAVLDYHQGDLRDDATVLIAEWRGPAGRSPRTPLEHFEQRSPQAAT
ncbi:serine/threonine-protein phosphatase [Planotetraspora sp. A-T 1434]|nr:serine/threonine-protein phosphatase [Planotetraspora sp. A-T 1434]